MLNRHSGIENVRLIAYYERVQLPVTERVQIFVVFRQVKKVCTAMLNYVEQFCALVNAPKVSRIVPKLGAIVPKVGNHV